MDRLTSKLVNRLTAKLVNRLTAKLMNRLTAKLVVVNLRGVTVLTRAVSGEKQIYRVLK